MQISLFQMQPISGDVELNLQKIERASRVAAEIGAELLVTPELAVTGYALGKDFTSVAEARNGPAVRRLQVMADEQGLAIAAGFAEKEDDGVVYNSAVVVRPRETPVFYRKCHLYGPVEKAAFAPGGEAPATFKVGGLRAGMLICYDVEFPEMVRGLALAGAELVIVPTALPAGKSARHVAQLVVPSRAMENQVFIAYADLCGQEAGLTYEGRSVIVAPDGEALARAGHDETILFASIDPGAYEACHKENPYLTDRRPELYGALVQR
ncbi:carbon-nitrogen hydrolase family protein [Rhizobiaceae bacterium n13]|uniref:Carbon-nitrogen hydrolase family protein n=1 Tax=Ferirhizobium litorale TaxID=2927786 RepID=A0AAE3Q788_9HYPH|nr:carbon-nitrogen hydrolase family protein [Fererhizobium litorale]MDI7860392.1 carbon-nitrogen hydrolase family protein [Fererhizobium litorale]MDI7920527.1 carbon-nitrogen hydrolase family protein [Fererhizobium litorale]